MKIEKSNNPAAVGALIVVLLLIVSRIGWMIFGQNQVAAASPAAAKVAAASPAAAKVAAASAIAGVDTTPAVLKTRPLNTISAIATPRVARNPFADILPSHHVRHLTQPKNSVQTAAPTDGAAVHVMPLPPLPAWPARPGFAADTVNKSPFPAPDAQSISAGHEPGGQSAQAVTAQPNVAEPLKLTAIVDGTTPMAVLQTERSEPIVAHVGDRVEGALVVAIDENDIIFARGTNRWKVCLQSAADVATEAAPDAAAPPVSKENIDVPH